MNISDNLILEEIEILNQNSKEFEAKVRLLENKINEIGAQLHLITSNDKSLILADDRTGKYKFLTSETDVVLSKLCIRLVPVWIYLECTYPSYCQDIHMLNIVRPKPNSSQENIISAISESLNISYIKAEQYVKDNKIEIPFTIPSDFIPITNVNIDFSAGNPMDDRNIDYFMKINEGDNTINTVEVKYLLVQKTVLKE